MHLLLPLPLRLLFFPLRRSAAELGDAMDSEAGEKKRAWS
jgi:hypothetical protein